MLIVVILEKVTATVILGKDDVELLLLLGVKLDGTRGSAVVIDTTMSLVVGTTVVEVSTVVEDGNAPIKKFIIL